MHMNQKHGSAITPSDVNINSRVDLGLAKGKCPLCTDCDITNSRQYQTHVGNHLEQFVLFVLPSIEEVEEAEDFDDSKSSEADEEPEEEIEEENRQFERIIHQTRDEGWPLVSPAPFDLALSRELRTVPPSSAGTEFSMHEVESGQALEPSAGAAEIAAAGVPSDTTVYRVTLDFKPTMDDEMELHIGQVVRLLHEYGDGWALCIHLDRSKQGVVPRTCLSTRPVEPRPPPQF
ncbi:hypothetical protein Daus18300_013410 [Diaporthe australafricana]|uniref:SH3 domain-containing protein n=1 Tax=Diaporthe australafricana TaxID=127596 RepID=A0ABR3VZF5_9PEZI